MRYVYVTLLVAALGLLGCDPQTEVGAGDDSSQVRTVAAAQDGSSEDVREAERLIGEMKKAYAAAPTLESKIRIRNVAKTPAGESPSEDTLTVRFGTGVDAMMQDKDMTLVAKDGSMFMEVRMAPGRYVKTSLDGDLFQTVTRKYGGGRGLGMVQGLLRLQRPMEQIMDAMTFALDGAPSIESYRRFTDESGRALEQIIVTTDSDVANGDGRIEINVDSKTKFLASVRAEGRPVSATGDVTMKREMTFDTKSHPTLPTPIVFNTAGKTAVGEPRQLLEPAVAGNGNTGSTELAPAPDFTLMTLDGEEVTLSDLQGYVVVLDFWATWCPPCRRGLPLLQEFHDWAEASDLPVKVFAVDVLERAPSREAKIAQARGYWQSNNFTMPSLVDPDGLTARPYGLTSIPQTYIIDPQGRIAKKHRGFDPRMVDVLKEDVKAILATDG